MGQRTTFTSQEYTLIQHARTARLATADEQGNPTLVPICYAYDGSRFYTPLDEKPKRVAVTKLRRVRNIQARPAVSLLMDQYDDDDWSRLGYVLIHGQATLVYPGEAQHSQALILLRERYRQYQNMALEQMPVIVIVPERITSWWANQSVSG